MNLKPDFALWAKMPEWERNEAAALLCGLDPRDASRTSSLYSSARWWLPHDQQAKYDDLRELASRAYVDGRYRRSYPPAQWLAWAKKYGLPVPPELEAEIVRWCGQEADCDQPTALENAIIVAINKLFPDGRFPARPFERDKAIKKHFKEQEELPPSAPTIRRALAIWKSRKSQADRN